MADRDVLKGKKSVTRPVSSEPRIQEGGARQNKTTQDLSNKKAENTGRAGKYKKAVMKSFTVTGDILISIYCAGCNEEFNTEEVMLIECERCSA